VRAEKPPLAGRDEDRRGDRGNGRKREIETVGGTDRERGRR